MALSQWGVLSITLGGMTDPRATREGRVRDKAKRVLPLVFKCAGEVDLTLPSSHRMHANLDHKVPADLQEVTCPYDLENLAGAMQSAMRAGPG